MNVLANINLRNKLIIMMLVPILALAFFAAELLFEKQQQSRQMGQLVQLTELASTLSALVHETQKERGASAGFIGSKGANFAEILPKQQKTTNTRVANVQAFIASADKSIFNADLNNKVSALEKDLANLKATRQKVNSLNIPLGEAVAWYTNMNAHMLAIIEAMPHVVSDASLVRNLTVYANYLQSKERAGIERAVLSATFGADKFAPNMFKKFVELVAAQDNYLHVFLALADKKDIEFYQATMRHDSVAQVADMRNTAFAKANTGGFNVEAEHWFATISKKINQLKQVDDYLATSISDQATTKQAAATSTIMLFGSIFVMSMLAALVLGYLFASNISRSVRNMQQVMHKTAQEGDFSVRAEVLGNDEFGTMAEQLNSLLSAQQKAIQDATRVITAIAEGNFEETISDSYKGDLNTLKQGVNASAAKVAQTMEALECVMSGLGQGNFSVRMGAEVEAKFRQQVNDAMQVIDQVLSRVGEIVASLSDGDFSQRMEMNVGGSLAQLQTNINRSMTGLEEALSATVAVAGQIGQGDLSHQVEGHFAGQLEDLKSAINSTQENLSEVVSQVRERSTAVQSGADEISRGNQDLANRTADQASSLGETAASMEQIAANARRNANNAEEARSLVDEAKGKADGASEVMSKTVTAMQQINDSSQQIAEIITLIDGIAFQTNLLALNASVEAARAGEHGRGFAVVAGEVRTLAQRTAESAKDIRSLIDDTNDRVKEGSQLVNDSGEALESIQKSVTQVADVASNIATSANEQTLGVDQVNQAISQLDNANQENAALVEEAAAASTSLNDQAIGMKASVEFFRMS